MDEMAYGPASRTVTKGVRGVSMPAVAFGSIVGRAARLAAAVGLAAAFATALTAGRSAAGMAAADPDVALPGFWLTLANGDTVRGILREDDRLWSATDGGGVLRWNTDDGTYKQWLAPQDGLPANDVRDLVRDRAGVLWAGTAAGLARLDEGSNRWLTVEADAGLLPSRSVTALAAAADGSIWVGLEQTWDENAPHPALDEPGAFVGGGLARFDPSSGSWGPVVRALAGEDAGVRVAGLPSDNVTDVAFGADGLLWVATRPFYAWREDACGRPTCPPEQAAWLAVGGGLALTDDLAAGWQHWSTATMPGCLASANHVTALAADRGGRMWVGTRGRGLQAYIGGMAVRPCSPETGHRHYERARPGLPGNHVLSLAVGADGRVWVGVGDGDRGLGVSVLDPHGTYEDPSEPSTDDTWEAIGLSDYAGPVDAVVSAIDVSGPAAFGTRDDRSGDGWGVYVRDGGWRVLRMADSGMPSNHVTAVAVEAGAGRTWLGTRGKGVVVWDGASIVRHTAFPSGVALGGLAVGAVRGSTVVTVTAPIETVRAAWRQTPAMLRLGDDHVPYEVGSSLSVGAGLTRLTVRPGLAHSYPEGAPASAAVQATAGDTVAAIAFDRQGRAWIATRKSLVRPAADTSQHACESFPDCWYDGGLSSWDGSQWVIHRPTGSDGLPIRDVLALAVDTYGRVWAGTGDPSSDDGDGVLLLEGDAWRVMDRGAQGPSFGGDVVSGLAVDPLTGDLWLATHHGRCRPGAATDDCPPNGRIGGGVSRYDGAGWAHWSKGEGSQLDAAGPEGNFTAVTFDPLLGRVWAGAWSEGVASAHWMSGTGIDASVNQCPRNCTHGDWRSRRFIDDGAVRALAVDAQGRLWVGASRDGLGVVPHPGGVKLYDGSAWWRLPTGVWSNEITALAAQGDGMWLGTFDGGAARWWPVELQPAAWLPAVARRADVR